MDERDLLADRFEANRTHLRAVAYRMLGSVSEADDAVQEAWLRLSRSQAADVENLRAWLTTVVARVCLDMLRSRKSRREEPLGAHVPEPIVSPEHGLDPEHEALLADSVGLALLVVLETLSPPERLAFVLHDMFAAPFDEIAAIVGRSPAAARSSRAARGAGYRRLPRRPTPISAASARRSTPFSPPPVAATSTRCSSAASAGTGRVVQCLSGATAEYRGRTEAGALPSQRAPSSSPTGGQCGSRAGIRFSASTAVKAAVR
ncbi:MAG TPA: sigma-70 family RNA polymerase sigma factor [Solirubrobacteraceae bacterium]